MKAIIVDTSTALQNPLFSGLSTKVINKTVLEHQVDKFKKVGINNVIIFTQKDLSESIQEGEHWNVNISIEKIFPINSFTEEDEHILIIPGNCLMDLDYKNFVIKHFRNKSNYSVARLNSGGKVPLVDYFHPTIMSAKKLAEIPIFRREGPQQLAGYLSIRSLMAENHDYFAEIFSLDSFKNYWISHKMILSGAGFNTLNVPGFPEKDNIWVDLDSNIHPQTQVRGLAIVGKNTKIHEGVTLEGFVVIGDGVVVDKGTHIENSIILDSTYIGSDLHISAAIANKNYLHKVDKNMALIVEENFIMGSTGYENRLFPFKN